MQHESQVCSWNNWGYKFVKTLGANFFIVECVDLQPNEDCDVSIKFVIDLHFVFVMKFVSF
jgi:hypothetical protein